MKCSVSFPSGKQYWKYWEIGLNSWMLSVFLNNRIWAPALDLVWVHFYGLEERVPIRAIQWIT